MFCLALCFWSCVTGYIKSQGFDFFPPVGLTPPPFRIIKSLSLVILHQTALFEIRIATSSFYCLVFAIVHHFTFNYFLKRFYLFMRNTKREGQRHRQREQQPPHREPDEGLDHRTLRSHPEPKADAQPLSHPGIPLHLTSLWLHKVYLFKKFNIGLYLECLVPLLFR